MVTILMHQLFRDYHALLHLQELLMSGLPDIDVEDWEKNTEYSGYDENSEIIKVQFHDTFCHYRLMWFHFF